MKSLYRRYRPLHLSDVVGQEQVVTALENSIKNDKISHAYLFVGPRGCGKTSVARILAHEINGFSYELEDDYVDIIEIDGASNRGIENIRDLREKVAIAPTKGKYKVYIIDDVHMLTKDAFNALLKTLEEPPKHAVFIMATTDAYKVPVTITSRAQNFVFRLADATTMHSFLSSVSEKEHIVIDDDALDVIVKKGGGSFRDSLSLLDQISTMSDDKITKDLIISLLGLPEEEKINKLLNNYVAGDVNEISSGLKEIFVSGVKSETLVEELISSIIASPKPELMSLLAKLPDVRPPFTEAKLLVAFLENSNGQNYQPTNLVMPSTKPTVSKKSSKESLETNVEFNWDDFLVKVKKLNDAIYAQLLKTRHTFHNNHLEIFPDKRIVKTILSRDNNKRVLTGVVGHNVKITIHDYEDTPHEEVNDDLLSKISGIMGGEVKNDGGGSPF